MMHALRNISAAAALTLALGASASAPLTVTSQLDSTIIVMGSQVNMKVELTAPVAAEHVQLVNAPEITNHAEEFGLYWGTYVVRIQSDTTVNGDRRKIVNNYTLQAFDPEVLAIPPVGATVAGSNDTVWADMLALKVLPVEVDTVSMAICPLAPTVSANNKWHDYIPMWIWWLLLAVAVIAGAIIGFTMTRKRKEKETLLKQVPVPPYELAIGRLGELRRSGAAAPGQEKHFYTELTDILRQYLHGRYGINALEMTSGQIVKALRSNPETRMPSEQVDAVLRIADFVKFAKEKPLADDNQRALQRATDFVEMTKPVPPPPVTPEIVKNQPKK